MRNFTLLAAAMAALAAPALAQVINRGAVVVPQSTPPSSPPGADVVPQPSLPPPQTPEPSNPSIQIGGGPIPQGSYQQTCRDLRMEGSRLFAVCKKADNLGFSGGWQATSLDTSNCLSSDLFSNEDGNLECAPEGSYRQSCKNRQSHRDFDILTAECLREKGSAIELDRYKSARLEAVSTCRPGTIQNLDGNLACDRR